MADDWKSYEPLLIPDIPNLNKIDVYEEKRRIQCIPCYS